MAKRTRGLYTKPLDKFVTDVLQDKYKWSFVRLNTYYIDDFDTFRQILGDLTKYTVKELSCDKGIVHYPEDHSEDCLIASSLINSFCFKWKISAPVDPRIKHLPGKVKFNVTRRFNFITATEAEVSKSREVLFSKIYSGLWHDRPCDKLRIFGLAMVHLHEWQDIDFTELKKQIQLASNKIKMPILRFNNYTEEQLRICIYINSIIEQFRIKKSTEFVEENFNLSKISEFLFKKKVTTKTLKPNQIAGYIKALNKIHASIPHIYFEIRFKTA